MRIALGVEYDGAKYCGWQYQEGVPSVQNAVEIALSKIANTPVRVITAGRTDTGVHATGQVIHFETEVERTDYSWTRGTSRYLNGDVTILWARHVSDDFHARFSAIERRYQYVILNRHERPAVLNKKVTWEHRPLDVSKMKTAAGYLLGKHNFNAYRALACQAKSPVRELRELSVERLGSFVVINARADGFLHHMIRNIAGVLCTIGAGEKDPVWSAEVLATQDRTCGGVTASPDGLYLNSIIYPNEFNIPEVKNTTGIFGL